MRNAEIKQPPLAQHPSPKARPVDDLRASDSRERQLEAQVKRYKIINAKRVRETEEARMEVRRLREILNAVGLYKSDYSEMRRAAEHFSQQISARERMIHEPLSQAESSCASDAIQSIQSIQEPQEQLPSLRLTMIEEQPSCDLVTSQMQAYIARANTIIQTQKQEICSLRARLQHAQEASSPLLGRSSMLSMPSMLSRPSRLHGPQAHSYALYNAVQQYYRYITERPVSAIEKIVDSFAVGPEIEPQRPFSALKLDMVATKAQREIVGIILRNMTPKQ